MKMHILFALLPILAYLSAATARPPAPLTVYAIPGQNGLGSEPWYIKEILREYNPNQYSNKQNITVVHVETPLTNPDLGQDRCIHLLSDTLLHHKIPGIVHATSQGTATALNYIATTDRGAQIKALILEAPLLSGNSAIYHTVSGPLMNLLWVTQLPCSYYWLPYAAKTVFPYYWPAGKQPITLLDQIPTDLPIVIVHSKNDPQLSYQDACALYYGLRKQGNKNVYFIRKEGMHHLNILDLDSEKDTRAIQTILQKHGLLPFTVQEINLNEYQPDHLQFKQQYDRLLRKETIHKRLGYALVISAVFGLVYGAKRLYS